MSGGLISYETLIHLGAAVISAKGGTKGPFPTLDSRHLERSAE